MSRKSCILVAVLLLSVLPGFNSPAGEMPITIPEIAAIDISDVNGTTEIKIKGTMPFNYTIYRPSDPYQIAVDLQGMGFGGFKEKIIVDRAGVFEIRPVIDEGMPNIARLEIFLTVPADIEPIYNGSTLLLVFENPDSELPAAAEMRSVPGAYEEGDVFESVPEEDEEYEVKKYIGDKISLDFQDSELSHVFRLIADISGYNVVVSPEVKGRFSMKLTDVPWDLALDVILRNYGLSKSVEENIIRVAPTGVIAQEEEEIAQAKESQEKAGDLLTRVYPVNYADVDGIKKAIDNAKILTKRGFISVDERTSAVIIRDVEQKHEEYEALIKALDVQTPQVNIDAKIVEVRTEVTKDLGIQWGIFWEPPDSRMTIGGSGLAVGDGFNSGNDLMVNLPAIVGPGKGGNLGLGYISASNVFALDLTLSALESTGKAKVVSNPKITTSDNEQAKIMQGEKIPYQTISQDGTQTEFIEAYLELTVTPHITPEGTVVMNLEAKKNEADFTRQVLGVPTIAIKEIKTQVLVKNNDTLVIGGIFTEDSTKNRDGVPGLSDIPILGRLFQKNFNFDEKNELLIFITPRVVR